MEEKHEQIEMALEILTDISDVSKRHYALGDALEEVIMSIELLLKMMKKQMKKEEKRQKK